MQDSQHNHQLEQVRSRASVGYNLFENGNPLIDFMGFPITRQSIQIALEHRELHKLALPTSTGMDSPAQPSIITSSASPGRATQDENPPVPFVQTLGQKGYKQFSSSTNVSGSSGGHIVVVKHNHPVPRALTGGG